MLSNGTHDDYLRQGLLELHCLCLDLGTKADGAVRRVRGGVHRGRGASSKAHGAVRRPAEAVRGGRGAVRGRKKAFRDGRGMLRRLREAVHGAIKRSMTEEERSASTAGRSGEAMKDSAAVSRRSAPAAELFDNRRTGRGGVADRSYRPSFMRRRSSPRPDQSVITFPMGRYQYKEIYALPATHERAGRS
jgi:hypothetical protein